MDTLTVPSGLAGVVVAQTGIGDVLGEQGTYHYRGHDAVTLARTRSLEAVWHLVQRGTLPDAATERRFRQELVALRPIPVELEPALRAIAGIAEGDSMTPLRTGMAAVSAGLGLRSWLETGIPQARADLERLAAVAPAVAAFAHRVAAGLEPVAPREDLGAAAHYLWLLDGEEPSPARARALETYLVSTIDHGFNSSTFAARVVASTGADVGGAVLAGLATLAGPLHGGAPSRALDMLDAIGTPDRAEAWVADRLAAGERIMGFGHRVYRTEDPRAALLRDVALDLGGPLADLAVAVEATVLEQLAARKPNRPLRTNVEYYAAVVLAQIGIPRSMFGPTFATSRIIGWGAHIAEQMSENRIIRPASKYVA
jgi:citrate synthase